jgi:hypothetical protein
METKIKMILILFMLMFVTSVAPKQASAQGVSVGFQVFYDELSPYGTWVISPDYGYVWVPDVAPGFTPYSTNGYWMLTEEGWTWVSDYPWGWAPFHYGRWYTDPYYGAMWVPDYEWGPGWVTWRRSAGFYGWAPIGPGVTITVAYGNGYYVPDNQWTFVRDGDFGRTNIHKYYINNTYNVTIINNSTVINNTRLDRTHNVRYNAGPARAEVEKRSGRKYTPAAIKESSRPVQKVNGNELQIYRPQVKRNTSSGVKAAPARVERLENVKTTEQRKAQSPNQKSVQPAREQPKQQPQQRSPKQEKHQPEQSKPPKDKGE